MLNTLLFANRLIAPRCIWFCPAALEAAGEEIIAAPQSLRPKQFQDAPEALPHPFEGAVPISLIPSDPAPSALFFHPKISFHSGSRIHNYPLTRVLDVTHSYCKAA